MYHVVLLCTYYICKVSIVDLSVYGMKQLQICLHEEALLWQLNQYISVPFNIQYIGVPA